MPKWDWYQGTMPKGDVEAVCRALSARVGVADVAPARAMHGYHHGAEIVRGEVTHATVWWGGNPGVHVTLTGSSAAEHGDWLREQGVQPSRVDACEDWDQLGLADELFTSAQGFALEHRIKVEHRGDWTRHRARTLYLGSPQSTARLVIYEKGHQQQDQGQLSASDGWVRLEVRLRPKRNRHQVAALDPHQAMHASPWIGKFLTGCLAWEELEAVQMGTVWTASSVERSRAAMLRQYGRIIAHWADEVGGWDELGNTLQMELFTSPPATGRESGSHEDQEAVAANVV